MRQPPAAEPLLQSWMAAPIGARPRYRVADRQPLSVDALAEWLQPYCSNLTFGKLTVHQGVMKRTAYLSAFAERKG